MSTHPPYDLVASCDDPPPVCVLVGEDEHTKMSAPRAAQQLGASQFVELRPVSEGLIAGVLVYYFPGAPPTLVRLRPPVEGTPGRAFITQLPPLR